MSYKIELIPSGIAGARPSMFRGGIRFEQGEPRILDLSKEELEVFKNDWRFKVSDSKDSGSTLAEIEAAGSPPLPPTSGTITPKASASKDATVEDSPASQEETVDGTVQELSLLDSLLKDFSRGELNKAAKKLGIKKPETFENKTEVAQAIVDAQ